MADDAVDAVLTAAIVRNRSVMVVRREYSIRQGNPGDGFDSVTAGGESWRWQLRDRTGEWIEMGAEVKWLARGLYRYGLVVGSSSPGVATVKEHITGMLHEIPSSRLEVVKSAAEVIEQVYESGGDWKRLGLARLPALQDFTRRAKAEAVSLKGWSSTGELLPDEVLEEIKKTDPDIGYGNVKKVLYERLPGLGFSNQDIDAIASAYDMHRIALEAGRKKLTERDPKVLNSVLAEFDNLRRTGQIVIAVPPFSAQAVFEDEDRRYKSQFETGESSGLLSHTERSFDELRRLGMLPDIPDEKRPVYGFITPPDKADVSGPDNYGPIRLVLKPGVRDRTTMTVGDSLSSRATPVPLNGDVTQEQMVDAVAHPYAVTNFTDLDYFLRSNYAEAQIQGGVSLDDIEKVVISERLVGKIWRDEVNEEILPAIERLGIPVEDRRPVEERPKPEIDPNAPREVPATELKSGDVISNVTDLSTGVMMVGGIEKVEATGMTTLIVKGVALDGPNTGRVITRIFPAADKVMLHPDREVASYEESVESLRADLDGLAKKYPDGLATALDKALIPEPLPPEPQMSPELKERLRKADYVAWTFKRGDASAKYNALRGTDPYSKEMTEALIELHKTDLDRQSAEIQETERLLTEFQDKYMSWSARASGGATIDPRSDAAQEILSDVQEIGARARLIVQIESARKLPAKATAGDAEDRRLRREMARDLIDRLVGTARPEQITQTWPSGYHNSAMSQRLRALAPAEREALTEALLQFPKSWALNFNAAPHTTYFGTRGYNYYDEIKRKIHINVSDPDPKIGLNGDGSPERTVITHEIGHSMETLIPGLKDLELLFWHSRVKPGELVMRPEDGAFYVDDTMVEKRTALRYTMKAYGNTYQRGKFWEVFTTGVQNVLGDGDTDYTITGRGDASLWDFTMGALLTLDTTPVAVPDPMAKD